MSVDYADYRRQLSPPWWLTGGGPGWNQGFGAEDNATQTKAFQTVLVRYPDLAPLDAGGEGSAALGYIQHDRALEPVYGDASPFEATRLYLKSGFSQGADPTNGQLAAGLTRPWLPALPVQIGDLVGGNGLVWSCTVGGTTGQNNPFSTSVTNSEDGNDSGATRLLNVTSGQVVAESTGVTWTSVGLLSDNSGTIEPTYQVVGMTPVQQYTTCENGPGWYWAGTELGFLDALLSAGLYGVDGVTRVPPRLYRERDLFNVATVTIGTGDVSAQGVSVDPQVIEVTVTSAGTHDIRPGDAVSVDIVYNGETISVTNVIVEGIYDPATLVVAYQLPLLEDGTSLQVLLSGTFTQDEVYTTTFTPSPPDGNGAAWARLWLVLPSSELIGRPRLWGYNRQMAHLLGEGDLVCTVTAESLLTVGSGTGSGSVFTLTSGTPWSVNQFAGGTWSFLDATGAYHLIVSNTNHSITVIDTLPAGVYVPDGITYSNPVSVELTTIDGANSAITITDTITAAVVSSGTISLVSPYVNEQTGITIEFTGSTSGGDSYELGWLWGEAPVGLDTVAVWGQLTGQNIYGLILNLAQRWLPAHVLLMGAWISPSLNTELDSIPFPNWEPSWDVTIDGIQPPYFQYN